MNDHNGAVHRCIHAVSHLIEDHAEKIGFTGSVCSNKSDRRRSVDFKAVAVGAE